MATTQNTSTHPITLPVGDWRVVPDDSELGFEARIVFGLIPVRGRYSGYAGELHVDSAGDASGSLQIEAATVSTGIKKRDAHLRSTDFFAVEEHPQLRFELDALVPDPDGSLTSTGTLHVRNSALAIETPISIENDGPDRLRLNADLTLDHRASDLRSSGSGWKKVPQSLRVQAALTLERIG